MYNEEFTMSLKKDNKYNEYLKSNWVTINTIRGKINFNTVLLSAATFTLVTSSLVTAYCGASVIHDVLSPKSSIFNALSFAICGGISGVLIKPSNSWRKHVKEKIKKEEEERKIENQKYIQKYAAKKK